MTSALRVLVKTAVAPLSVTRPSNGLAFGETRLYFQPSSLLESSVSVSSNGRETFFILRQDPLAKLAAIQLNPETAGGDVTRSDRDLQHAPLLSEWE